MAKSNNKQNSTPPTKKGQMPAILTLENIEKVEKAITLSGKIGSANNVLGVSPTTIIKWRKKFPEFGNRVSHALEKHRLLTQTNHPELFITAMEGVHKLLNDREIAEITTIRERLVTVPDDTDMELSEEEFAELEKDLADDDEFPNAKVVKEITKTRRYIREPNWSAIEKVLGKKQLQNIIYSRMTDGDRKGGLNIVHALFGRWMNSDELGTHWNGSLFNDMIDLMMIRMLQAETRQSYEAGELPLEEYSRLVAEQSKIYGYIAHNRESRAIKLLKGKSYFDIIDMVQSEMQKIINVVELVCSDVSIKRNQIPSEVVNRIKQNPELGGFASWAEYKARRPAIAKSH